MIVSTSILVEIIVVSGSSHGTLSKSVGRKTEVEIWQTFKVLAFLIIENVLKSPTFRYL